MRELDFFPLPEGTYWKSSAYGWRNSPTTGAKSLHKGVDYAAPHGTPLLAPFDGQVTTGFEAGGAGNWIWVANGSDLFKSFHHSGYVVSAGWVKAGAVIAYIGTTGSSTGPHAHLELWENGANIDPTGFFDRAPFFRTGDEVDNATTDEIRAIVREEVEKLLTNGVGRSVVASKPDGRVFELFLRAGLAVHLSPRSLENALALGVVDIGEQGEQVWDQFKVLP